MSLPAHGLAVSRLAIARRFPLRAAAIVVLVLVAYHYSLMTLARGLTLQTPLAYLALVPVIALVLAAVRVRFGPPETPIHDRQVDWIVGLGLLAAAGAILILAPQPESSGFWLRRIDLLTLPLYVAGLVALFFGVRRLWALRLPIVFLLLAWPVPFTFILSATASGFTDVTATATGVVTRIIPVAEPAVGDPTLFIVGSGVDRFAVSIGTACSGVNSFVGFLLLGAATLYLVRGPLLGRAAWLAAGLAVTMALNLARITAILIVGDVFGEAPALDILHPMAGLILFNLGVLAMLLLAPRFGLRFAGRDDRAPVPATPSVSRPAPGVWGVLVVALGVTAVLGLTNATYARYEAISVGLADARLAALDIRTAHVSGWEAHYVGSITQGRQYFGETSTWERVAYQPTSGADVTASRTVYLDVMTTDDSGTFAAYGLEACYTFHGYDIASVADVDVGAGVTAQVIDYVNTRQNIEWSALWWEWPYTSEDGDTRYQRIVVFMADGPKATFEGLDELRIETQDARFARTDQFLATLGRSIVSSQLAIATAGEPSSASD
ncbi:MAG: exosortase/archaeosortase family protein [Candidatus Limnocylindria bacterium]